MPFATCWATEVSLKPLDEVLLCVLGMQPSEIAGLEMDDYWDWVGAAERKLKRDAQRDQALYGLRTLG